MLSRYARALFGREPMSVNDALTAIVGGGGALVTLYLTGLLPGDGDPWFVWLLWGIVALAAALLFLRGLISVLGTAREVTNDSRMRAMDRLPVEFRSPVIRKTKPYVPAPLGIFDMELAFDKEGKKFRRALESISEQVTAIGALMEQYTPRFHRDRIEPMSLQQRVNLSREFARKIRPKAQRMKKAEAENDLLRPAVPRPHQGLPRGHRSEPIEEDDCQPAGHDRGVPWQHQGLSRRTRRRSGSQSPTGDERSPRLVG